MKIKKKLNAHPSPKNMSCRWDMSGFSGFRLMLVFHCKLIYKKFKSCFDQYEIEYNGYSKIVTKQ
jgi:hypothetical protein